MNRWLCVGTLTFLAGCPNDLVDDPGTPEPVICGSCRLSFSSGNPSGQILVDLDSPATGLGTVTVEYSTDNGSSWQPVTSMATFTVFDDQPVTHMVPVSAFGGSPPGEISNARITFAPIDGTAAMELVISRK